MGDFYFLIVVLAVYFYMDKRETKNKRRWIIKRRTDIVFSVAASVGCVFLVAKKKRILFIRLLKRLRYDDFDIPAFNLDKNLASAVYNFPRQRISI